MRVVPLTVVALATFMLPAAAQEMREYTDALGRTVEIPVEPQRIQSMYDLQTTLPLVELGAPVVGSYGRLRSDGTTYLRAINTVMNVDFDNSDITFTHAQTVDFEAIAALEPDLIIGLVGFDIEYADQLQEIAPTVILEDGQPALDLYRDIADVSGQLETYEDLLANYQALLADARTWLGDHDYTYTKLFAINGDFYVYANYGALTMALDGLGFTLVGDGVALRERGLPWGEIMSVELLPAQDADFVFATYRIDQGPNENPALTLERFEELLPGFCDLLTACADGRFIVTPREHAAPISFRTLTMNIHYIVSHVAGRPGIVAP